MFRSNVRFGSLADMTTIPSTRAEEAPAQGWGSPCGIGWKGANQTSRAALRIRRPREPPALSKYDPAENSVAEHCDDTGDDDRCVHFCDLVALRAVLFVLLYGHRLPPKKWPHLSG